MKRILIIDDEKDFCFFIKKNLERAGEQEVCVCNDSRYAVEMVREFQPSLILLDIAMPYVSGGELAAELAGNDDTRAIPIIFLTAMVRDLEVKESHNMIGGHYFIAKPVRMDELIGKINQLTVMPLA